MIMEPVPTQTPWSCMCLPETVTVRCCPGALPTVATMVRRPSGSSVFTAASGSGGSGFAGCTPTVPLLVHPETIIAEMRMPSPRNRIMRP